MDPFARGSRLQSSALAEIRFPFLVFVLALQRCNAISGRAVMAGWQSGYAAACKAVDAGSIPTPASIKSMTYEKIKLKNGETFRHLYAFSRLA